MQTLPNSPAGRQAAWVLQGFGHLLKGRDIREKFAPSFLEAVSPLKVRAVTLSMKSHLPLDVIDVSGDDFKLIVSLQGAQGPLTLRISVDTDEPHRIVGLRVQPAGSPVRDALRRAQANRDVGGLIKERIAPVAAELRGARAGLAVAVRFGGDTTASAFGAASVDSVFEIGSVTKPITATLLAEMISSTEVTLNDAVERHLPPGILMPSAGVGGPITLLELATHSSGLPRLPVNLDVQDEDDPYASFTIDALFDGLSATALQSRGNMEYSNLGYALLGQVLARAARTSYEEAATKRVLEPLGMVDASVGPDPQRVGRRVPGHHDGKVVPHWTMSAIRPAGGVEATVIDVSRFATAHAVAAADSPLGLTQIPRLPDAGDSNIGLGWMIERTQQGDVHWHNGGTGGFRSFVAFHRESQASIAVLANSSDDPGPDIAAASILGSLIAT